MPCLESLLRFFSSAMLVVVPILDIISADDGARDARRPTTSASLLVSVSVSLVLCVYGYLFPCVSVYLSVCLSIADHATPMRCLCSSIEDLD